MPATHVIYKGPFTRKALNYKTINYVSLIVVELSLSNDTVHTACESALPCVVWTSSLLSTSWNTTGRCSRKREQNPLLITVYGFTHAVSITFCQKHEDAANDKLTTDNWLCADKRHADYCHSNQDSIHVCIIETWTCTDQTMHWLCRKSWVSLSE